MKKKINDSIVDKLAYGLSTMAMFYGVAFLVIAPLFFQRPANLVGWMQYLISVFFQGVALPVLGYVSRKAGEKQEKLLQETHDAVMKELAFIKEQHLFEKEDRKYLIKILTEIHQNIAK
jgi:hypothetical protein